jgi:voltage-gated potassium channel
MIRFFRRPPLAFKIGFALVATVLFAAAGFVYFERPGKPELGWDDAFWWAVVTMTTVGYGDFFPVSAAGRFLIAYPTQIVGVGYMGFGLGQLARFLFHAEELNRKGHMVTDLQNHILVCNYGTHDRFARMLHEIRNQSQYGGRAILLVDAHLEALDTEFSSHNVGYIRGNPALAATLHRAGVTRADQAVVLAENPNDSDSDNATVATCLTLRALAPKLHVVAECVEFQNREVVMRAGCDSVVCITNMAPGVLAQELHDPGVIDVLEELTVWNDAINNIFIVPVQNPDGHSVSDLRAWAGGHHTTLLGVRSGKAIEINPDGDRALQAADAAILVCRKRPHSLQL